ncbi:uncharacterized protein LOC124139454 isoform X1 [Haliotis rufescens]|uniref:uncharacterized protein LOC124139454 isoform X1 n=1 Tax=Haliotis rufescens TaxID=6454 RepID=UPI001EAFA79C|nr:uncharacterized protein LOC124139454 isoform X1 [Haliotis rufescens]
MDETAMEILFDGKHGLSLKQGLNKLYKDKTLCDVTLTSSDGIDIQAHWLVLAAHSDFLRHLAVSRNVMQFMVSDTGSLKLNIDSEILKMILDYLYTGELVVTKDSLHKIKQAAKVLQLSKALALLERSHLSCLGDQSYEAESEILQPTELPLSPVLELQQLPSQQDQGFAVVGTLTQSPASYSRVQSMQAPFVQVPSTASPMASSQGHLQGQQHDTDCHRLEQAAPSFQEEASLQPTIVSVESLNGHQTAFSPPSFCNAYLHQRPHTKDSSHEQPSVSSGKDGEVYSQQEGKLKNTSMEVSPSRELFMTNGQGDDLYGNTNQGVHSTDLATSPKEQDAFSEPSCVSPEHEDLDSSEPGRRRSEPIRPYLDEDMNAGGRSQGRPLKSCFSFRSVGKDRSAVLRRRGRPQKVVKGLGLDILKRQCPKSQCPSVKYVNLCTKKKVSKIPAIEKQMNHDESSASVVLEVVSTNMFPEEGLLNEQPEGESSQSRVKYTSEDLTAQNGSSYLNGSSSTSGDCEVDLGLVKTEQPDAESGDLDYVIYENADTSDTDSCGRSFNRVDDTSLTQGQPYTGQINGTRHRRGKKRKGKVRNCRVRNNITSKLQIHSSSGSKSYHKLRSALKSKYLLSHYVHNMCIWKTEMSPFQCKVCKGTFKHLSYLKYHCLSKHLTVKRQKVKPQIRALTQSLPSIQAALMEDSSVPAPHPPGSSWTLRTSGKPWTKGTSQTAGSDGKFKRTRRRKAWKFVLPTINKGSGKEGERRISRRMSTKLDHTTNNSLLQDEDRHQQNVVFDNNIPSTSGDNTSFTVSDESEKSLLIGGKSMKKGKYNSARYHCDNCAKPFHFKSNMLRHLKFCNRPKVKDKKISQGKVIGRPKKIPSSSVVADVKKSPNGRATNLQMIVKYINGTTCTLCNKTFSRADTTRMHIRAVHFQQKRFTCVCNEVFSWSAALSVHKKTCSSFISQ